MFIPVRGPLLSRRLVQLVFGLIVFGIGVGLTIRSGLGVAPWDVLHQGLALRFGGTVGLWSIVIAGVVLLVWIPLREPYGLGTLLNALIVGVMIDITLLSVSPAESREVSWIMLVSGIATVGLASGMYIGADFGAGPRDGLMTNLARRGMSIRVTRSLIEVSVLLLGWSLGGTVGVGTLLFAVSIGPFVQLWLPYWQIDVRALTPTDA